ncbi:hypothetical protein WR25_03135 [Diploscapter pachys]|uniref:Uncharacterized protein n=1 Tax=Diploscapter pachys TaxID=2018661 RepID=A0A2A2M4C8_9BILA|nr:hypothetical protein WR25_03135 [Diploscapter pachys]
MAGTPDSMVPASSAAPRPANLELVIARNALPQPGQPINPANRCHRPTAPKSLNVTISINANTAANPPRNAHSCT